MDSWELVSGLAGFLAASMYGLVGERLSNRPVSPDARLPSVQFTIWWYGLGLTSLIAGIESVLASVGMLTFAGAVTALIVQLAVDSAALWGLVGYLAYVYSGRYYALPISAFFGAFYVAVLYAVVSRLPYALTIQGGLPVLEYATPLSSVLLAAVAVGVLAPELGGAILYLSLVFRTRDRTLRYRILMVSASIFLVFSLNLATPPPSLLNPEIWVFVDRVLESGGALLALMAYYPPSWVRSALGVGAVSEVAHAPARI